MASNSLLSQIKIYNDIQTIYKLKQTVLKGDSKSVSVTVYYLQSVILFREQIMITLDSQKCI